VQSARLRYWGTTDAIDNAHVIGECVMTARQLATLIPHGGFEELPGVAHNLWSTDPHVWVDLVTRACRAHIDASG
jgi:pimeloyl-ACP methyl ester carboxylesterase